MHTSFDALADQLLQSTVSRAGGAPGVIAMATDREANFYAGAAGVREVGKPAAMTTDTVVFLASCTKAITGVAVMQLVEEGLVSLGDAARNYLPQLGDVQVLDGFSAAGEPLLRKPNSDITLQQLMLHTAGFGYEYFDANLQRYRQLRGIPSLLSATYEGLVDVLVHDPGARWTYGTNIEWLGLIVEKIRGKRLGEVLSERIFAPLGMEDIGFTMTPSMRSRLATIHLRAADGQLTPAPELVLPQPPALELGGAALYASIGDYMKFIRMILNDGDGLHGRVLRAATVQELVRNGLGALKSGGWTTQNPAYSNSGEFFPDVPKSWAYTFQVIDEDAPTGRPAGSLSWAGLANTYFWIDRKNGLGGMWTTQVLPFQDIGSYPGFLEFESMLYRALHKA